MATLYDRIRNSANVDGQIPLEERKIPVWPFVNDTWLIYEGLATVDEVAARWDLDAGQTAELNAYLAASQKRLSRGKPRINQFHELWHLGIAAERGVIDFATFDARLREEN